MWRFLAGVASALLLCGAGLVLWTGGNEQASALPVFDPPLAGPAKRSAETASPPEAEARTREQKRFDRYDKDRNELITAEEYLANRRKAYAKLDANGDGRLSFEEWAKKTTDKFAKADNDTSRALSRTEFATTRVIRKTPPPRNCPPPREDADDS